MRAGSALRWLGASVGEMATPANRARLVHGIWSGYAVAIGFGFLAAALSAFDLTAWHWAYFALVAVKLGTNSLAWLALVRQRAVLAAQVVNSATDILVLTCGIYLTGGPHSPLLATYVILIAVIALLSNLGVTVLTASLVLVCFSAMMVLMAAGVLPPQPVPGTPGQAPSVGHAITAIGFCAVTVGVPAFFASAILRTLRAREAVLEQRTAQLIQAATQRSQFVASMTHELRTPIHGVQGLADVIAAGIYGPVTDKQKDACASIKRSAQSLLSLIDDLLALTRAEAGKLDARPGPVDIPALVDRVTASVSWMVGTKQLSLAADVAPGLPSVASDERWLAHVLVNLVSNAVKFTPEGGQVTVRATGRGAAVALEVTDTGIGIAPEDRAAIFEPFRQAELGDAKGYGGVGLGLALVARLTDLLGADVELDSVVGKGSTFRVIVPLAWRGRTTQLLGRPRPPSAQGPADPEAGYPPVSIGERQGIASLTVVIRRCRLHDSQRCLLPGGTLTCMCKPRNVVRNVRTAASVIGRLPAKFARAPLGAFRLTMHVRFRRGNRLSAREHGGVI